MRTRSTIAMTVPLTAVLVFLCATGVSAEPVVWNSGPGANGHSYEAFLCPSGVSWDGAQAHVSGLAGDWHLATSTSAEENAFLYDLVDDNPAYWNCCLSNNSAGPWLGGFSSCYSCNDWQWVTGEPWSYTNWGPLEPFSNGEALGFFGYHQFMGPVWNDVPSDRPEFGYVVECPAGGNCPPLPIAPGCGTVPVEERTWGRTKSRYR